MRQPTLIGIFDSGVGGLTVLKKVRQRFPESSFIYFADTAHLPYGNKTSEDIRSYASRILSYFQTEKVRLGIMGCHTTSSWTMDDDFILPHFPLLNILDSTVSYACQDLARKRFVVWSTSLTMHSGAFQRSFKERHQEALVISCPNIVPLIESGCVDGPEMHALLKPYINQTMEFGADTLVFGCTHYPFLKSVLQDLLPSTITFIDSGDAMAQLTGFFFSDENVDLKDNHPSFRIVVSGDPKSFESVASKLFFHEGPMPVIEHVNLEAIKPLAEAC